MVMTRVHAVRCQMCTHWSLADRAVNAWDLTFGRTQLAHHAPSGHSLQRLTDQLQTDTAEQPPGSLTDTPESQARTWYWRGCLL